MTKLMKLSALARSAEGQAAAAIAPELGALPEWNLGDLYAGMDAPAFAEDLARGATDC
jgi:oligoendopeptidase F